jgi:hypothetical protein
VVHALNFVNENLILLCKIIVSLYCFQHFLLYAINVSSLMIFMDMNSGLYFKFHLFSKIANRIVFAEKEGIHFCFETKTCMDELI